jgi:hypothetical protein
MPAAQAGEDMFFCSEHAILLACARAILVDNLTVLSSCKVAPSLAP